MCGYIQHYTPGTLAISCLIVRPHLVLLLTDIFISILPMGWYPSTTKSSYVNPSIVPISSGERLKWKVGNGRGSRSSWILSLNVNNFRVVDLRLDVIFVDVRIAHLENKLVRLGTRNVRNHVREKRITCNVEGYAEPEVAASLIHQTREFGLLVGGLGEGYEELAKHVTGGQGHEAEVYCQ